MTSPYRALCDELKDAYAWCLEECMRVPAEEDTLIQRARAALAQQEPEGPTDDELLQLAREWNSGNESIDFDCIADYAREVLARYGGSTSFFTED